MAGKNRVSCVRCKMRWGEYNSENVAINLRERFLDLLATVAICKAFVELANEQEDEELIVHDMTDLKNAELRLMLFMGHVKYLGLDSDNTRLLYGYRRIRLRMWLTKRYKKKYA